MSIAINTHFVPFKMDLEGKKPVRLDIEIINRYLEQKKVKIEVFVENQLGLNKTSSPKEKYDLGLFNPGETKTVKLDIFPKNFALKGEQKISVVATEITIEETGYAFPSKRFRKTVELQLK